MAYDLNAAFKRAIGPSNFDRIYSKPATINKDTSYAIKPFQESGFVGFTGVGTDQAKQYSFGNFGTQFVTEEQAKTITVNKKPLIDDQGKSTISGKGVFTTFSDAFRDTTSRNLVALGQSQIDASDALEAQAASTAGAFAGLKSFITQVQEQVGQVDKRLSEQVTQIGKDTTELGQNGDGPGDPFWETLAKTLGISVPILAVGGIAALLLLRR
jgi:hypothetical protein|tara:strand:- start:121 stop:759 length:639 start_codon:yes stop_codon:yes gene_type:complete